MTNCLRPTPDHMFGFSFFTAYSALSCLHIPWQGVDGVDRIWRGINAGVDWKAFCCCFVWQRNHRSTGAPFLASAVSSMHIQGTKWALKKLSDFAHALTRSSAKEEGQQEATPGVHKGRGTSVDEYSCDDGAQDACGLYGGEAVGWHSKWQCCRGVCPNAQTTSHT